MQDWGYGRDDAGLRIQARWCRISDTGFRMQDSGYNKDDDDENDFLN